MITKLKNRKMNPMLLNVLLISGGVHLAAIMILGGITVYKYIIPDEAQFEEPPQIEEVEPPKEMKIEIRQQAAAQPQAMQNLRMRQVGNIAVANVSIDLPTMEQSFTVSSGMGGFSGGALLGGTRGSIGIGMSDVNVFGLKSRAERFLFAIDASKTMLTDEKGGLYSYRVIKDEISTMVSNLSAGTLFNVVFFNDGRFDFFKDNPIPAGTVATQELIKWITPINSDVNKLGLPGARTQKLTTFADNEIQDTIPRNQSTSGHENAYLSQIFLEQSIDAIYVITGRHNGFQKLEKRPSEKELEKERERRAKPDYQEALQAYQKEHALGMQKAEAELVRRNAQRIKKGLPPQVIDSGLMRAMGIKMENKHPGGGIPTRYYEVNEVKKYFKELSKMLYDEKGGIPPSINVVLFLAGDEEFSEVNEDALKDYTLFCDGKYRVIRGLDEIKSASSAKETKN